MQGLCTWSRRVYWEDLCKYKISIRGPVGPICFRDPCAISLHEIRSPGKLSGRDLYKFSIRGLCGKISAQALCKRYPCQDLCTGCYQTEHHATRRAIWHAQSAETEQPERSNRPKMPSGLREQSQNEHSATRRAIWQDKSAKRLARAISASGPCHKGRDLTRKCTCWTPHKETVVLHGSPNLARHGWDHLEWTPGLGYYSKNPKCGHTVWRI